MPQQAAVVGITKAIADSDLTTTQQVITESSS